jgi:hypothetical protein
VVNVDAHNLAFSRENKAHPDEHKLSMEEKASSIVPHVCGLLDEALYPVFGLYSTFAARPVFYRNR